MHLRRIARFVLIVQSVLLAAHFFLYKTWTFSSPVSRGHGEFWVKLVFALLSISFVTASLLAFRYTNAFVRAFYRAAAVWLGLLSFLFFAAIFSWILFAGARVAGLNLDFHRLVEWLFGTALLVGVYGVFNASWTRVTRATIQLANLPPAWRGRTAVLISDLHLGHVRNGSFMRRMVAKIVREAPDAIFIAGDLYDGTAIDAGLAAQPLSKLTAPQGVFFVAGNHEQFGDDSKYLNAISAAGVRVLTNEKVEADGLQIVGIPYRHAANAPELASVLQSIRLDRDRPSILLVHAPDHPAIAEA
ncbi:MAG: metallophosphoesterase, partial [Candidatus Sulfotelmatobacter sp.]